MAQSGNFVIMDGDDLCRYGYFRLAKYASDLSTHHQFKIGAVITNKKPIVIGFNLAKTHPLYANEENGVYSIHAEVKAVLNALSLNCDIRRADMWVYREKADGSIGTAKPCKHCMAILIESGIRRVYYSDEKSPSGYSRIDL